MKKRKNNSVNRLLLILILLLAGGLCALIFFAQRTVESISVEDAGMAVHADQSSKYILRENEKYPIKSHISTVLIIGSDQFKDYESAVVKTPNRNPELADFLVLLVLDHNEKTITPLQLNRDTICEVPWLDENGTVGGYTMEHLTYAHSYGSGGKDSCANTVRAVRRLLYNAPIESYLAFTMDALPVLNDAVGGVTITLSEDIPRLGKQYTEGATITLDGESALKYIRYREKTGGSNYLRMKRQLQYLYAFADAARANVQSNTDLAVKTIQQIDPYLCTNMTAEKFGRLYSQLCEYTLCETCSPSGDVVPGEQYYEFYVHEDSLWSCVYNAYCVKEPEADSLKKPVTSSDASGRGFPRADTSLFPTAPGTVE